MSDIYPRPHHYIDRCECGVVLAQCRCIGPKTERVISPCRHKPQKATVVRPASSDEAAAVDANGFGAKRGVA